MLISLNAPADSIVRSLELISGDVSKGQRLMTLEFLVEPFSIGRLQSDIDILKASDYLVSDMHIAKQRERLIDRQSTSNAYHVYLTAVMRRLEQRDDIPDTIKKQYEAEFTEAKQLRDDAGHAIDVFDSGIEYQKTERESQHQLLASELSLIQKFLDNQNVVATIAGSFTATVGEGGFVEKGQTLGTLSVA